jgi:hypothetical protein
MLVIKRRSALDSNDVPDFVYEVSNSSLYDGHVIKSSKVCDMLPMAA